MPCSPFSLNNVLYFALLCPLAFPPPRFWPIAVPFALLSHLSCSPPYPVLRHSPCAAVLPAAPIASCFLPCWRYLVPHCPPLCPFYTTTLISTCLLCYPVLHSAPALYLFLLLTSFLPLSSADLQHAATLRAVLYSLFPSSPASPPHPAIFPGVHSTMTCPHTTFSMPFLRSGLPYMLPSTLPVAMFCTALHPPSDNPSA